MGLVKEIGHLNIVDSGLKANEGKMCYLKTTIIFSRICPMEGMRKHWICTYQHQRKETQVYLWWCLCLVEPGP